MITTGLLSGEFKVNHQRVSIQMMFDPLSDRNNSPLAIQVDVGRYLSVLENDRYLSGLPRQTRQS